MPTMSQSLMDPATPSATILNTPTMTCYTGYEAFPKPPTQVQPLTTFGQFKPCYEGAMTDDVSDLLHAQYRLSLLQWNAGAASRQPTRLVAAMCGAFNAVLLQEAHDHVPQISDQFNTYSDDGGLAILLYKDMFLPGGVKYPIIEEPISKTTWGLKALVICGHLRRPPDAPEMVTFCSVHLHNVIAKRRDAATSLLQRLYVHMKLFDVEFVGGDFNMAVKGPVADVFSDAEFMAPGSSPLCGAGGLEGGNSCACHADNSTGSSTSVGSTRSTMNNGASMRETKAHTIQSSCISGQPTTRVAPERPYEATQHKRDVHWRRQRRTTASFNGA